MTNIPPTEPEAALARFQEAISHFLEQWPEWRLAVRRQDAAILNKLREAIGGQMNGALRLTSEGLMNRPFINASAREPGSFNLELKGLTGPQLLAVGNLLAEQASAANWIFPHPARTVHVDDTNTVAAIDPAESKP